MKHFAQSWRLVAILALVAVVSLTYVKRTKAFTLIETQYLPAVQLSASQLASVKVTNVTSNAVEVEISIFADGGKILSQRTVTVPAVQTVTIPVQANAAGPLSFHTVVALGTAHSAISDVMLFDKTTGQVVAILPYVEFDTN